MISPFLAELTDIIVVRVKNTAPTTYADLSNTYRHFVENGIGDYRNKP